MHSAVNVEALKGGIRMTLPEKGVVVGPGEGRVLLPGRWWLPLGAADTPGGTALLEMVLPPGTQAPRPHLHHHTDEVWYVLDGRLTFHMGEFSSKLER